MSLGRVKGASSYIARAGARTLQEPGLVAPPRSVEVPREYRITASVVLAQPHVFIQSGRVCGNRAECGYQGHC